jgi:hypothetical protein
MIILSHTYFCHDLRRRQEKNREPWSVTRYSIKPSPIRLRLIDAATPGQFETVGNLRCFVNEAAVDIPVQDTGNKRLVW